MNQRSPSRLNPHEPMIFSYLRRTNQAIVVIGDYLSWVYLFIVGISVYEVLMRYAFNRPTTWVHESSLYLAGMVMIYAGLYAFAVDKHIAISVITDLLPKRMQRIFLLVADAITLLYITLLTISAIFITKAAIFAPDGRIQLERSGSSWNSVFPAVVKICMSFFLLLFAVLVTMHVIAKCIALKRPDEPRENE